ncbi:major capsid protein [Streptomyces sp. NPDC047315]|uniref:major capsid protein n=1 Tax=Streptomyces sp. NPDC047315 TaxID=3155142 RepID=UPI0033EB1485
MPVTLAQAQVNTQSDVDYAVIDNLRRYSWLLDQMVFDDTATPGTGGSSLTYSYTRLSAARSAAFRAINSEYTPSQATRQRYSVDLKPLGGTFQVDRVISHLGQRTTDEVAFQMQELLTATRIRFQDELINGDVAVDANGFDGLDKALAGTATEYLPLNNGVSTGYVNWTPTAINSQALAMAQLDVVDDWLSGLVPSKTGGGSTPGALPPGRKAILGNTKSVTRLRALARWAGIYSEEKDDVGRKVQMYGDWVLVDIGDNATGASPIIPIETRDPDGAGAGTNITGLTDIYAVTFGLDSFHAASPMGVPLVQTWLPDFTTAKAVKDGEVEMGPAACVLKNTKSAGVLRNVKVQ